jgi:hypothetical protein
MLSGAEVAQIGRAPDSTTGVVGGEAEDRVVASSSPALGTTEPSFRKERSLRNFELRLILSSLLFHRFPSASQFREDYSV